MYRIRRGKQDALAPVVKQEPAIGALLGLEVEDNTGPEHVDIVHSLRP